MAATRNTPSGTSAARIVAIESDVRGIADSVRNFIEDSKEWRRGQERDIEELWKAQKHQGEVTAQAIAAMNAATSQAITAQGDKMMGALSALENRNRISWGGIVATGGLIFTLVAGFAGLGHYHVTQVESKIGIALKANEDLTLRGRDRIDRDQDRLRELETKAAYFEGLREARK